MKKISRRRWLAQTGMASASLLALPELSRVLELRRLFVADELLAQSRTLTASEYRTLQAICARLIPTDDTGPGAVEAHAAYYIDQALGGALAASREQYAQGLAALNAYAHVKALGSDFVQLTPEQQDEILTDLEADRAAGFPMGAANFFNLVRNHTVQGTFCDPIYGGNAQMVGWDLIGYPGVRLNVTAGEQNMSSPAKPNHKSAYDYLMFSKTGVM